MGDLTSAPVPALREDDHLRGRTGDPLVVFYGDFSCPYCAVAHDRLRELPIRVAFRHFALRTRPRALALACAAEAAGRQGAFWELHDALLEDPSHTEDPHIWAHAERLGLDLGRLQRDRQQQSLPERIGRDTREGMRAGVAGTPTLFVGGLSHPGPPSPELTAQLGRSGSRRGSGRRAARQPLS